MNESMMQVLADAGVETASNATAVAEVEDDSVSGNMRLVIASCERLFFVKLGLVEDMFRKPAKEGVSGFLCLGRLFQGQPNEAALCI